MKREKINTEGRMANAKRGKPIGSVSSDFLPRSEAESGHSDQLIF